MRLRWHPLIYTSVQDGISGYRLAYCSPAIRNKPAITGWLTDKIEEIKRAEFREGAQLYVTTGDFGFLIENRRLARDWAGRPGSYVTGYSFSLESLEGKWSIVAASPPFAFLSHDEFVGVSARERYERLDAREDSIDLDPLTLAPQPTATQGEIRRHAAIAILRFHGGNQVLLDDLSWNDLRAVAYLAAPNVRPYLTFCIGGTGVPIVGCGLQQHSRPPTQAGAHVVWVASAAIESYQTELAMTLLTQRQNDTTADSLSVLADGVDAKEGWQRRDRVFRHRRIPASFHELAAVQSAEMVQAWDDTLERMPGLVEGLKAMENDHESLGADIVSCFEFANGISMRIAERMAQHAVAAISARLAKGIEISAALRESQNTRWHRWVREANVQVADAVLGEDAPIEFSKLEPALREEWMYAAFCRDATLLRDGRWRHAFAAASDRIWALVRVAAMQDGVDRWIWSDIRFLATLSADELATKLGTLVSDQVLARLLASRPAEESLVPIVRRILSCDCFPESRRLVVALLSPASPRNVLLAAFPLLLKHQDSWSWAKFIELAEICAPSLPPETIISAIWCHERRHRALDLQFVARLREIGRHCECERLRQASIKAAGAFRIVLKWDSPEKRRLRFGFISRLGSWFSWSAKRDQECRRERFYRAAGNEVRDRVRSNDSHSRQKIASTIYYLIQQHGQADARIAVSFVAELIVAGHIDLKEAETNLRELSNLHSLTERDRKAIDEVWWAVQRLLALHCH